MINLLKIVCVPCIVDENIKIKRENYQSVFCFIPPHPFILLKHIRKP